MSNSSLKSYGIICTYIYVAADLSVGYQQHNLRDTFHVDRIQEGSALCDLVKSLVISHYVVISHLLAR